MFILNSGYDSKQVTFSIIFLLLYPLPNIKKYYYFTYDYSPQIRLNLAPNTSGPDNAWLSCRDNIRNCNSTQIEFLDGGLSFRISPFLFSLVLVPLLFSEILNTCCSSSIEFRNTTVNELKVVYDKKGWGMFIDSCFTHCQTIYGISWNSPVSPRLGNKARS
jgi:hypothetical protein